MTHSSVSRMLIGLHTMRARLTVARRRMARSSPIPISQSANVIFYNSQWAKELGFANPPTNYAEFKEQACAATAANTCRCQSR